MKLMMGAFPILLCQTSAIWLPSDLIPFQSANPALPLPLSEEDTTRRYSNALEVYATSAIDPSTCTSDARNGLPSVDLTVTRNKFVSIKFEVTAYRPVGVPVPDPETPPPESPPSSSQLYERWPSGSTVSSCSCVRRGKGRVGALVQWFNATFCVRL